MSQFSIRGRSVLAVVIRQSLQSEAGKSREARNSAIRSSLTGQRNSSAAMLPSLVLLCLYCLVIAAAPAAEEHESALFRAVLAVRQRGLDRLDALLAKTSDPSSPDFGQHLSRHQVAAITACEESLGTVLAALKVADIAVLDHSLHGEYVVAEATETAWRSLLSVELLHRLKTSLSVDVSTHHLLGNHVSAIFNGHNRFTARPAHVFVSFANESDAKEGRVTPSLLKREYNIATDSSSRRATQSIYEGDPNSFSPSDLLSFQRSFDIPSHPISSVINQSPSDYRCKAVPDNCEEGNLDTQYILSASQASTSVYIDTSDDFVLNWITKLANENSPAQVLSISYGMDESDLSDHYIAAFNTEALKLSVMGVSIIASSGDDGVHDRKVRETKSFCGYSPHFPASSRYVTAVGGTQGPESGLKEIACQSQRGGGITTGGGFSKYNDATSYQTEAISQYFSRLSSSETPVSGFHRNGRGYPDVSLLARNYVVVLNGEQILVGGTSASAPVFAGMVSLVNGARLELGKKPLGFLNPALYKLSDNFINDITSGSNKCAPGPTSKSASVCCAQGFEATKGWDPVTGLGSIDFKKFKDTMMSL